MPLATPTLILNTDALQTGDLAPFFTALGSNATPPAWRRVSGSEGPLIVILATADSVTGNATRTTITGDLRLRGKIDPAATELTLLCEFTQEGGEGDEYYEAGTFNLAIDSNLWGDALSKTVLCDFEEVVAGEVIRSWRANLELVRGVGDGGSPAPLSYVGYFAQSATEEQKAQARENIGASSGSGDVVSDGTITAANSGKVAVVTDLKEIGAGVAYGVGTEGSIVIHDSTITMANTTRLAQVSGDSNGMIEAGPVYSQTATASSIVQRDSSGNIVVNGINSYSALFTDLSVNSYIDCDGYTRSAEFFNNDNSFSVGTDGAIAGTNITANGHFKSQGDGAGGAGHLILAQGTTPNGTGSSTTLWGIANGIGWRNGNGTAYSLTLPTASGTLALVDGNLGTPTTLTLTNATGLPIAGGGTGASTALTARMNLGLTRMSPVHGGDGSWVTATVSGTVGTNTYFGGTRTGQVVSATAGFGRFYYNSAGSSNIYTGSRTILNWSTSFRVDFRAIIYLNTNASSKVTFIVATGTGTTAHDLAALGLAVQAYGNGSACRIRLQAHNGTTATNGTDVAWTTGDENFYDFSLVWTPGTGATLYKDDVSLCSISTGLPSGNSASNATCPMFLFENGSGSSDATTVRLMSLTGRR